MEIQKVRQHLQAHPEAVKPEADVWASMRDTLRESRQRMFEPPPDVRAALAMLRAARDGDRARALALASEFLGREPDALLLQLLTDEFAQANSVVPLVARGMIYHRQRLATDSSSWYEQQAKYVYGSLRKSPQSRLIQALRSYGGSPYARLGKELPGAIVRAEGDGFVGQDLLREVEECIFKGSRRAGLTAKKVEDEYGIPRDKVGAYDSLAEVFEDPRAPAAYDGTGNAAEVLDRLVDNTAARAGLTPRERQVLRLLSRGLSPMEIAVHLGIARSTVYSYRRRFRAAIKAA